MAQSIADKRQFNLAALERNQKNGNVIPTNDRAWTDLRYTIYRDRDKAYTYENIKQIIESGSDDAKRALSRHFLAKNGFYKQTILYYATLLKYVGILIPHPNAGYTLSTPHIEKRYNKALDFIESASLPILFTRISQRALADGTYFGVLQSKNRGAVAFLDLPSKYCVSRFKDVYGNDLIEFDVSYFNTITDEKTREVALDTYPEVISNHYREYIKPTSRLSNWCMIPAEIGICFPFLDGTPPFLHMIPATMQYDASVEIEKEKYLEEIRKIIVQKIPHNTSTDALLFEPDEALEMHQGTVEMMKGNKNVSVLTTYADVDAIVSNSSADASHNSIEKMLQNVFNEAGLSSQLFSSTGSTTLKSSVRKDIAIMMILGNQYSLFITNLINKLFGNANISFKYIILPVGEQNWDDFIKSSKDLAALGYSWLVPAIAQGFSQRDLLDLKKMENEALKLIDLLIPLQSAFQTTDKETGAPKKSQEDKAEQTIKNEESKDNTAGGST